MSATRQSPAEGHPPLGPPRPARPISEPHAAWACVMAGDAGLPCAGRERGSSPRPDAHGVGRHRGSGRRAEPWSGRPTYRSRSRSASLSRASGRSADAPTRRFRRCSRTATCGLTQGSASPTAPGDASISASRSSPSWSCCCRRRALRSRPRSCSRGDGTRLLTRVVKVTISRLRRKLGAPPVIETVPGAGYRI
jgi:hypothetical protein